jgi:phosphate ABC transporter phosphate-binding protein
MMTNSRRALGALLVSLVIALGLVPATVANAADTYVPISGAGSSWSSNAIDQWRRNVQQYGMRINYASTGSSDGRNQFKNQTVDFAVSEIPYGLTDGGVLDAPPTVGYAYMPIVAGGTAFMYNLQSGGKKVTNLRLSGAVITKIFTGVITSWDDPLIKADNPDLELPKRAIVPVVRSDGSGSTAQFTTWMSKQYQGDWDAYCAAAGRSTPCGITSNFPVIPGKGFIAQPNSQGVSGYVAQAANIGTITYVEYSYALKTGFPVAKVLNKADYYVEPTASNVAVGLLGAKINEDKSSSQYLTQILDGVYNNADPRAYPLSSYSYMVVPTSTATNFTNEKGKTLGAFANYFLCEGQQQAEVLGYSPLPINLVQAGLDQVSKIPGADTTTVNIASCNNPTFSKDGTNTLAANAPQPAAADKRGATQSTEPTGGAAPTTPTTTTTTTTTTKPTATATTKPTKTPKPTNSSGATDDDDDDTSTVVVVGGTDDAPTDTPVDTGVDPVDTSGETVTDGSTDDGLPPGTPVDPNQGGPVTCDPDSGVCVNVIAAPVEVTSTTGWTGSQSLMLAAVATLIGLIVFPPLVGLLISRRKATK